jgi:hypothetical protein
MTNPPHQTVPWLIDNTAMQQLTNNGQAQTDTQRRSS